jgi:predicted adenylyl cyclase CyaB
MATNIEIKARVRELERLRRRIEQMSETREAVINQEDVFFNSPGGRLKLRVISRCEGQLIYYERGDACEPRPSDYFIFDTSDPDSLIEVLGKSLGIRGIVRKRRSLYSIGNVRIHLDEVEGLGAFVELEVVLDPGQSREDGVAVATRMMEDMGIDESDLVAGAYIDLLEARRLPLST